MKVEARVFFVGGASASGKSTACEEIAVEHDVLHIELDVLHNSIQFAFTDEELLTKAMNAMTEALLRELIAGGADAIVEGGWMQPVAAAKLLQEYGAKFYPVFCGYPDDTSAQRLQMIRSRAGKRHWIANRVDAEQLLNEHIAGSAYYKREAQSKGVDFVDFTVATDGCAHLAEAYRRWRALP